MSILKEKREKDKREKRKNPLWVKKQNLAYILNLAANHQWL